MGRWLLSGFIAILLLSSVVPDSIVSANSLKDLQQEKKQLENKKKELDSTIKSKESELQTNKSSIESILGQIQTLNTKVQETNDNITRVEAEIAQTTAEIEALHISITDLETKIQERDIVLRERVRSIQVNGGSVSYLDVLLGANSFSDFIDRFSAVTTLVDADRTIMQQQADDQKKLEEEKELVEQKLVEQEESKEELQSLKDSLESQKKEKDGLVRSLEKKQEELSNEKEDLEHLFAETNEMSQELEQEIVAEQKRIAEIARVAAEEKKRQAAQQSQGSSSSSSGSGSSVSQTPPPNISSGTWTRPASGRFTSPFGWRTHPIHGTQRQHRGLDIANSVGTPIVAAGDGVVSRASWHNSYGNHVMITHVVDGQVYTTVYAHLSSLGIGAGQQVSKGQYIGGMGSTGDSTGSHLHFEFHVGYYSGKGPSAVNPLNYVPF